MASLVFIIQLINIEWRDTYVFLFNIYQFSCKIHRLINAKGMDDLSERHTVPIQTKCLARIGT